MANRNRLGRKPHYALMKDGIRNKAKPVLYNAGDNLLLANGTPTTTKECCILLGTCGNDIHCDGFGL